MLKTAILLEMLTSDKLEIGDNEGGNSIGSVEIAKKSGKLKGLKLSKSGNSKGKKSAKSKKPSKNRNSPIFDTKKTGPSFLTSEIRIAFNRLWLAFTKTLILQHFDLKCHI